MTENMTKAIEIKGLTKTYSNGFVALKGLDLSVEQGDFFALLGPNGAGKSTTIGVLCSLVNKTAGQVRIMGVDIDQDFPRAKSYLGVVPQEFNFSVFEKPYQIVMQQAGFYGLERHLAEQRTEKYLRQLQLWDKRDVQSRTLSGGQKRRLMIARALIHEPKVLILDEPTAGVDIEIRRTMWDFLRTINSEETTIILTTHYLEEAENLCQNIAIINHGEVVHHSSMDALLRTLKHETYVLDLDQPVSQLGALPHHWQARSEYSMEVTLEEGESLNTEFEKLARASVQVMSMRNKTNRLEQLFMNVVEGAHHE